MKILSDHALALAFFNVRDTLFRGDLGCELYGLFGNTIPRVHGNDRDGILFVVGGLSRFLALGGGGYCLVVMSDAVKEENQQWDEDDRDPCAFREFRDEH